MVIKLHYSFYLSIVFWLLSSFVTVNSVSAQAPCSSIPSSTYGKVNYSITLPQEGVYKIWSRVNAPSLTANSFQIQLDNTCAITVGNASTSQSNVWEWIDFQDGDPTKQISTFLSAGTHTVTVYGSEPGLKLDTLFLTKDSTCKPSGMSVLCETPITPTAIPTSVPTATPTPRQATPTVTRITTPSPISIPTATPLSCITTSDTWINQPIPEQISEFTFIYDAIPNANNADAVTGLSGSTATSYSQLAAIARFNPAGYIDARNGDNYVAKSPIRYSSGTTYTFRMVVSPIRKTYSVYVKTATTPEQIVGENLAFRTEQKDLALFKMIAFTSEENSNKVCNVRLNNQAISLNPIPNTQKRGLQTIYFDKNNLSGKFVARIEPTININWQGKNPQPGIDDNTFSVRWSGYITPLYTESYTFTTKTDDGVRLWINNKLVIDQWNSRGNKEYQGKISLEANRAYNFRMEYRQESSSSFAYLYWQSKKQNKQIVPEKQFSY